MLRKSRKALAMSVAGLAVLAFNSATASSQEVKAAVKYGDMQTVTQDLLDRAAGTVTISCTPMATTSRPAITRTGRSTPVM